MRSMIIKMVLLGLMLFLCKASVLGQDTDIRCKVSSLDFNLSQHDPEYLINFGSFSLLADGEKGKGGEGVVAIAKFYKLPRTKLILSVFVVYIPKGEELGEQVIVQQMVLGKKRFPITYRNHKFDDEKIKKDLVSMVFVGYPMKAFDEGGKGNLHMMFLGKKHPVPIMMTCKKVKKASL